MYVLTVLMLINSWAAISLLVLPCLIRSLTLFSFLEGYRRSIIRFFSHLKIKNNRPTIPENPRKSEKVKKPCLSYIFSQWCADESFWFCFPNMHRKKVQGHSVAAFRASLDKKPYCLLCPYLKISFCPEFWC